MIRGAALTALDDVEVSAGMPDEGNGTRNRFGVRALSTRLVGTQSPVERRTDAEEHRGLL